MHVKDKKLNMICLLIGQFAISFLKLLNTINWKWFLIQTKFKIILFRL